MLAFGTSTPTSITVVEINISILEIAEKYKNEIFKDYRVEYIHGKLNKKDKEVQGFIDDSQAKIAQVEEYTNLLNTRKGEYQSLVEQIDKQNENFDFTFFVGG